MNLLDFKFNNTLHWLVRLRIGLFVCLAIALNGCGTTTTRTATEQLLMSDAVDQAISQIDFTVLRGQKVYIDTQYLLSVKGVGFVNSEYIISSLRQQLSAAHCFIQDARDAADVIVEPRVGALGTDGHEVVYGIPQSGSIANAAAILSSSPVPAIPEISFGKSNAQTGIAKVIVFAYDRKTREAVWQSGIAKAESTSSNTWYLGAGPFQKGSIYEGMRFAGQRLPPPPQFEKMANQRWLMDNSPAVNGQEQNNPLTPLTVEYESTHIFQLDDPVSTPDPNLAKSPDQSDQSAVRAASHAEPAKK